MDLVRTIVATIKGMTSHIAKSKKNHVFKNDNLKPKPSRNTKAYAWPNVANQNKPKDKTIPKTPNDSFLKTRFKSLLLLVEAIINEQRAASKRELK